MLSSLACHHSESVNPPHPDILQRLAKTYSVPVQALMVEAGYLPQDKELQTKQRIEQAYQHVISDPTYAHGTRLHDPIHASCDYSFRELADVHLKLTFLVSLRSFRC